MMYLSTTTMLRMVTPPPVNQRQGAIISAVGPVLSGHLDRYEINTPLRVAHFLAQIAHESDGFHTCQEYATGGRYEGRTDLGNTEPGDGMRFKGRGLIQMTGRANYTKASEALGIDFVNFPEKAEEPVISLLIACDYWKTHKINAAADRDDLYGVTRLVNGGLNGVEARRGYLIRAKKLIQEAAAGTITPSLSPDLPTLHRGMLSEKVAGLQEMLSFVGWPVGIDGDYGAGTETAVKGFQRVMNLKDDGIVGPATWAELHKAVLKRTGATGAAKP